MSVISGLAGADAQRSASSKAADSSKEAAKISSNAQLEMFNKMLDLQQPYNQAGTAALGELQQSSPTSGSDQYLNQLQNLPGLNLPSLNLGDFSYTFDPNDPTYLYRQQEMQKTIDQAAAARGNYNSRASLDALAQGNLALTADESQQQFQRAMDTYNANTQTALSQYNADYGAAKDLYGADYGKMADLFNMSNQLGTQDYNKLIDLVKIGQGSASTAGAGATATGQGLSNIYGQLGDTLANSALASGQATANLMGNIGSTNTAAGAAILKYLLQ